MISSKKGQGLSLNVIIIAALALVVLVVLIIIFTQQTTQFERKVSEETQTELFKMRIFYSSCKPNQALENVFLDGFEQAESDQEKEEVRSDFRDEIDRCTQFSEGKDTCEQNSGCVWG